MIVLYDVAILIKLAKLNIKIKYLNQIRQNKATSELCFKL